MKRIAILALLLAPGVAFGQTSINCSAAGVCGNQILHANNGNSTTNSTVWYGSALSISGSFAVPQWNISLLTVPSGAHITMGLVCDDNLSGATIASGGNCSSSNVVCSWHRHSILRPAMIRSRLPGVPGPLPTNVRYWVFQGNDNNSFATFKTDVGGSPLQNSSYICRNMLARSPVRSQGR